MELDLLYSSDIRRGSMLTLDRSSPVPPIDDHQHRPSVAPAEPTPVHMIGPPLRSRFDIDEPTLRAWSFGPPRVDPP
jgi:hypothetical protein